MSQKPPRRGRMGRIALLLFGLLLLVAILFILAVSVNELDRPVLFAPVQTASIQSTVFSIQ